MKATGTRIFKVMEPLAGNCGSHLRFRGRWVQDAGFYPGMMIEVSNPEAGRLELRVMDMAPPSPCNSREAVRIAQTVSRTAAE